MLYFTTPLTAAEAPSDFYSSAFLASHTDAQDAQGFTESQM